MGHRPRGPSSQRGSPLPLEPDCPEDSSGFLSGQSSPPAARWASSARPGDEVPWGGPRRASDPVLPADTCYVLSFAVIMLNTSLHNPNVRDRPPFERFVSMNRGINGGGDLPEEQLRVGGACHHLAWRCQEARALGGRCGATVLGGTLTSAAGPAVGSPVLLLDTGRTAMAQHRSWRQGHGARCPAPYNRVRSSLCSQGDVWAQPGHMSGQLSSRAGGAQVRARVTNSPTAGSARPGPPTSASRVCTVLGPWPGQHRTLSPRPPRFPEQDVWHPRATSWSEGSSCGWRSTQSMAPPAHRVTLGSDSLGQSHSPLRRGGDSLPVSHSCREL